MSTRCNIIIRQGKNHIYLYRHCDGYPAETGASIAEAIKTFGTPECHVGKWARLDKFMGAIMAERYDATSYSPARPIYEFTTDTHGDIEYLYEINLNRDPDSFIRIAARPREWHIDSGTGFAAERWINGGAWYSLAGLISKVNAERVNMNKRLAELRAKSTVYADADDYPMVSA